MKKLFLVLIMLVSFNNVTIADTIDTNLVFIENLNGECVDVMTTMYHASGSQYYYGLYYIDDPDHAWYGCQYVMMWPYIAPVCWVLTMNRDNSSPGDTAVL